MIRLSDELAPLGLSVRSWSCLSREGYTIEAIRAATDTQLLSIHNIGKSSIREIREAVLTHDRRDQCKDCPHHKGGGGIAEGVCYCVSPCGNEDEEREHPGAERQWQEIAHKLYCGREAEDKCALRDCQTPAQ